MIQSPLVQHGAIYDKHESDTADLLMSSHESYASQGRRSVSTTNNPMINDNDDEYTSRLLSASSFSRRFSYVNPNNTAKLTTFLLLNSMIGSGILNQPFVFKESGILGAIIGFIVATGLTWVGLLCLTAAGIQENVLEYSGLAHAAFDKNGERTVDIAIIVLTFGSQLGYILVVGATLSDLLQSWGCENAVCGEFWTTIISITCFVTPVCMYRHFGHLAWLSVFSIAAILAVMGLVFIGGPIKHEIAHTHDDIVVFDIVGMLASLGSIVFSLDCASSNFQAFISTEMKSQNMDTWGRITGTAVSAGAVMCVLMGIVGYVSFGNDTEGMILDNFTQAPYDLFKLLVVIHLILYIPSNFVIMRYSIVKLTTGKRSELLPKFIHTAITIALLAFTVIIVLVLMSLDLSSGAAFSLILNITGGVGGSMEAFILPAAIYLKVMSRDSPLYNYAIVLFGAGICIMIASVTMTFLNL